MVKLIRDPEMHDSVDSSAVHKRYLTPPSLFWIIVFVCPLLSCLPIFFFWGCLLFFYELKNRHFLEIIMDLSSYYIAFQFLFLCLLASYFYGGLSAFLTATCSVLHYKKKGCITFEALLLYAFSVSFLSAYGVLLLFDGVPFYHLIIFAISVFIAVFGALSVTVLYLVYLRTRLRPCSDVVNA